MIVETMPEIQQLSHERKLLLAAELIEQTIEFKNADPDPEVLEMLDERLAEFDKNPDDVSPWSEVKARILASRG